MQRDERNKKKNDGLRHVLRPKPERSACTQGRGGMRADWGAATCRLQPTKLLSAVGPRKGMFVAAVDSDDIDSFLLYYAPDTRCIPLL